MFSLQDGLWLVQIVLAVVLVYKILMSKEPKKFLKKVEYIIKYLERQSKLGNMGHFVELVLEIMSDKSVTEQEIQKIMDFTKQISGVSSK